MYEKIIKNYYKTWIVRDRKIYDDIFCKNAIYHECYGPSYYGLPKIKSWFDEWILQGTVHNVKFHEFIYSGVIVICKFTFDCTYKDKRSIFNVLAIFKFNKDNKIVLVDEYESKFERLDFK